MASNADNFKDDFWHSILDTVAEGIVVVGADGHIRHLNTYAAYALDISPTKSHGRHFREIFCPSLPESQCWVNRALSKSAKLRHHRFLVQKPDGQEVPVLANFTPITNTDNENENLGAIIAVWQESSSEQLRREREKQRAILGSLAEGLLTVDNEWRITSFNRAAERITRWREDEAVGKYCNQVLQCLNCADKCPISETLRRAKPIMDCNLEIKNRNEEIVSVIANTTILYNAKGEALGGIMSFRDNSIRNKIGFEEKVRSNFYGMIGKNKRILEVQSLIEEIADSHATVLILGESGTGKELVANAIQKLSPRVSLPYVKVNCAAIPDTLIESELFGHVRGAFTDARNDRVGRFELAHGGTIFLDEVGDLTAPAQLRLLRVLENGEFQRLGSSETVKVDVRVIAATNRDLGKMIADGSFRDDLYYRLNVIPISLPPLRERMDDLPLLLNHFLVKYQRLTRKSITDISDHAYDLLMAYNYPGNVRELENIIEHAFARTNGRTIAETKLPYYLRDVLPKQTSYQQHFQTMSELDDDAHRIKQALLKTHWNREKAAKLLGMSRTTLWRRMRELDIAKGN